MLNSWWLLAVLIGSNLLLGGVQSTPFRQEWNRDAELGPSYSVHDESQRDQRQFPFNMDLTGMVKRVFGDFERLLGPQNNEHGVPGEECDEARFQLPVGDFQIVSGCQLNNYAGAKLKKCILSGELSKDSKPFQKYLMQSDPDRVQVKTEINSDVNSAVSLVTVRTDCVDERIESINSYEEGIDSAAPTQAIDPPFQLPAIDMSGLDRLFSSLFSSSRGGIPIASTNNKNYFSGFKLPSFNFPTFTTPNVDGENCESKRFNLTAEDFNEVQSCYRRENFKECLRNSNISRQDLIDFVVDPDYVVVSHTVYSYSAWSNGENTLVRMLRLERCQRKPEQEQTPQNSITSYDTVDTTETLVEENQKPQQNQDNIIP